MRIASCLVTAGMLALLNSMALADRTLVRVATMPSGAEVTGLSTNAFGDLLLNAQHPGGKDELKEGGTPALVGYVHGFDTANDTSVTVPAEEDQTGVSVADGEYVIFGRAGDMLGSGEKLGGVYGPDGTLLIGEDAGKKNIPPTCAGW